MSSFVEEFTKYRKQERWLTGATMLVSVLAPVALTTLINNKAHWIFLILVGLATVSAALWIQFVRSRISEKLLSKYETLDVGSVLAKKIGPKDPRRFVITNRGYNHYYLKCLSSGEQVLVSKDRVREDFDIAN